MAENINEKLRWFDENKDWKVDIQEFNTHFDVLTDADLDHFANWLRKFNTETLALAKDMLVDYYLFIKEKQSKWQSLDARDTRVMQLINMWWIERKVPAEEKAKFEDLEKYNWEFTETVKDINWKDIKIVKKDIYEAYLRFLSWNNDILNTILKDKLKAEVFKVFATREKWVLESTASFYDKEELSSQSWIDSQKVRDSNEEWTRFADFYSSYHNTIGQVWNLATQMTQEMFEARKSVKELTSFPKTAETNALGYYNWIYEQIESKYNTQIQDSLKWLAKNYWEFLINSDQYEQIIQKWWIRTIKIWELELTVNLDKFKDKLQWKVHSKEEMLKVFNENIDYITNETNWDKIKQWTQKIWNYLLHNPDKFAVDTLGIIFWWAAAVYFTTETWWLWLLQATVAYTAVNDTIRLAWYWTIGAIRWDWFVKWMQEWYWLDPTRHQTLEQMYAKKWFDFVSNAALFASFWATFNLLNKMWVQDINIAKRVLVEAGFFTGFQMATTASEKTMTQHLASDFNQKEAVDKFTSEMSDQLKTGNIFEMYLYNVAFITAVRGWIVAWDKYLEHNQIKVLLQQQNILNTLNRNWDKINNVFTQLQQLWYKFQEIKDENGKVIMKVFDKNGNEINPATDPNFKTLYDTFQQNIVLAKELKEAKSKEKNIDITRNWNTVKDNPESWRWGTAGGWEIPIANIRLQDVLTGFGSNWTRLSPRFQSLIDEWVRNNRFNTPNELTRFKENGYNKIVEELQQHYWRTELTKDELGKARELADQLEIAIVERIRLARWEIREMDIKLWDPNVMKQLIGEFIKPMNEFMRINFVKNSRLLIEQMQRR